EVEGKHVQCIPALAVLAIHGTPEVEARSLALVQRVVVQERRDDAVLAVLVATGKIQGCEPSMQAGGAVPAAARAALPAAERRPDQVEAAVCVVVEVAEQRRQDQITAAGAPAPEV